MTHQYSIAAAPVWAKLRRRIDPDSDGKLREWGPPIQWRSLVDHSADVAAVFAAMLRINGIARRLAALAGRPISRAEVDRLSYFAAIHDIGKANAGFQARWREDAPLIGHVMEAFAAVRAVKAPRFSEPPLLQEALPMGEMLEWFSGDAEALLDAFAFSFGHHGRPIDTSRTGLDDLRRHWKRSDEVDPIRSAHTIAAAATAWFPLAFGAAAEPLPVSPHFWHAAAGLLTLADWIASDERLFPLFPVTDLGEPKPFEAAAAKAGPALAMIGFDPTGPRQWLVRSLGGACASFDRVSAHAIKDVQRIAADWRGVNVSNVRIVALESETGSGKTEAALFRFARLFAEGEVDGLYFALPTRVAATSLHRRVEAAVRLLFPEEACRPEVVLAVPGLADSRDRTIAEPDGGIDRWAGERAIPWAAERPKRFLAGTIAVGTIDQALLAAIKAKHAHLRLAALMRHLLVVDEVHASDAYMAGLLRPLLAFHAQAGGHALLLSATLGAEARLRLTQRRRFTPPTLAEALAVPYPAISDDATPTPAELPWRDREKCVRMALDQRIGDPESVAGFALDAARQGAKVLVIRNLRRDAIDTFMALQSVVDDDPILFRCHGVPTLHHGRYAREDRTLLDDAVESAMGRERPPGGLVLIGTQTLEIALDIDADLLITDLCPSDVLLQRLGRLHRHYPRSRPAGFEVPRAVVLAPERMEALLARGRHGLGGDLAPYPDLVAAEATRRLILDYPEWRIPAMNRMLVELAVHSEAREALVQLLEAGDAGWSRADAEAMGSMLAKRQSAGGALVPFDKRLTDPDVIFMEDERAATRLGARDFLVELPAPHPGPFCAPVRTFAIPDQWLRGVDHAGDVAPAVEASAQGELVFVVQGKRFAYGATGLNPS
jgi:CRISPR-associated endonuclease/helicase Cas3